MTLKRIIIIILPQVIVIIEENETYIIFSKSAVDDLNIIKKYPLKNPDILLNICFCIKYLKIKE